MQDRIQAREANAATGDLTSLEARLAADVNLINSAHANPAFKELKQHNTRGGDKRTRRLVEDSAAEELTADGSQGGTGVREATTPLVVLEDLGPVAAKLHALSDGMWSRAFLAAYNSSTAEEC